MRGFEFIEGLHGPDALAEEEFRRKFDEISGDPSGTDEQVATFLQEPNYTAPDEDPLLKLIRQNPNHMRAWREEWDEMFRQSIDQGTQIILDRTVETYRDSTN